MKKALIIRFSSLGDVVLTSVVIDPLIELGFEPYLLTFKPYDELFYDDNRLKVIGVKKEELFKREFLERLKKENFSLFLDLHKNLKTLLLRLFLKGEWRSYKKESIRRRLAVKFKAFRKRYYVTESYLKTLNVKNFKPFPKILVSEERLKKLKETLPENFIVLSHGARYRKKRYPYFDKLAELIEKEGFNVVWIGSEEEGREVPEIGLNLCGKLSLTDVLGVIKLARAFVGNDSGLLHCARAVGTKAIQIYGGTHPTLGFSLYPEEGEVIIKGLSCQPCDIHGKGKCKFGTYECLEIPPEEVFKRLMKLIIKS